MCVNIHCNLRKLELDFFDEVNILFFTLYLQLQYIAFLFYIACNA